MPGEYAAPAKVQNFDFLEILLFWSSWRQNGKVGWSRGIRVEPVSEASLANVSGFPPKGASTQAFNPSSPSSLSGPPSGPPHRGPEQLSRNRASSLVENSEPRSDWLPLFTPLAVPLVAYYTELFSLRGRHKGLTEGFLSMAKGENELKILRFDVA